MKNKLQNILKLEHISDLNIYTEINQIVSIKMFTEHQIR